MVFAQEPQHSIEITVRSKAAKYVPGIIIWICLCRRS